MSKEEEEKEAKKQREDIVDRLEDVREELRRVLVENAQQTHPRAKVKAKGTDVLVVDKERFEKLETIEGGGGKGEEEGFGED